MKYDLIDGLSEFAHRSYYVEGRIESATKSLASELGFDRNA